MRRSRSASPDALRLEQQRSTPAPDEHNAKSLLAWAGLFLFALGIRWIYLQELSLLPDFSMPAVDAAYHDYWAWGLNTGTWGAPGGQIVSESPEIATHPFFRPPGYPYALAGIYAVFGHSFTAVRWVQFALGALSAVLAAELGRQVISLRGGLLAGIIVATHWVVIYFDGELQPPVLATPLVLAGWIAALHAGIPGAAVAGLCIGLAGLAIPNCLIFAPVIAAWFVHQQRRSLAPWVLAVALLTLTPSAVRNYRVSGEFVPISTNFGINLYAGNNPSATGHDVDVPGFGTSFDHLRLVALAEDEAGVALTHAAASRYWSSKAVHHMVQSPFGTAALTLKKGWMFWADREIFSNKELNIARTESRILLVSPWRWSVLLGLATLGLAASGRRRPAALGLAAGIGLFSLTYLPFFVTARYRVPVIPILAVLASLGVDELLDWEWERLRGPIAAGAALLLLAQVDLATPINPAHWHHMLGVSHARQGQTGAAMKRFTQAIEADPEFWSARYERARLTKEINPELAFEDLRFAHSQAPTNTAIALEYGIALNRVGRQVEAAEIYRDTLALFPDHALIRNNLALLLGSQGDLNGAIQQMKRTVASNPDFGQGWVNLGNFCGQAARYEEAASAFERATQLGVQGGKQNWAQGLSYAGHHDQALALYREWVAEESRAPQSLLQLAQALQRADRPAEALVIFEEAYDKAPTDPALRAYRLMAVLDAGDPETALQIVEAALAHTPADPYMTLQHALLLSAHTDPSRRDGSQALEIVTGLLASPAGQRAETHEVHGCALAELGRVPEARAAIDRALELAGPDLALGARLADRAANIHRSRPCRIEAGSNTPPAPTSNGPDR